MEIKRILVLKIFPILILLTMSFNPSFAFDSPESKQMMESQRMDGERSEITRKDYIPKDLGIPVLKKTLKTGNLNLEFTGSEFTQRDQRKIATNALISNISIDGDQELIDFVNTYSLPGSGTASSPYRISGFDIGSNNPCFIPAINIINTRLYVEISNNVITDFLCGYSGYTPTAVKLSNTTNIIVSGNSFTTIDGIAITIEGSQNIEIQNNQFNASWLAGIVIDNIFTNILPRSNNITVQGNSFLEIGSNRYLGNPRQSNLYVNALNVSIRGNEFLYGFSPAEINIIYGSGIEVTGNTFLNNSLSEGYREANIFVYQTSTQININGNKLDGNVNGSGISISGASEVFVINNTIQYNRGQYGILVYDTSPVEVRDNLILSNDYYSSIMLSRADGVKVINNAIGETDGRGIVLIDSNPVTGELVKISGNTIMNNSDGMIIVSSMQAEISGNTISFNNKDGITVLSSNDTFIYNNSLDRNKGTGINMTYFGSGFFLDPITYIWPGVPNSNATIKMNQITGNQGHGIYIHKVERVQIMNNTNVGNKYGQLLSFSSFVTIEFEIIELNEGGIRLYYTDNTLIKNSQIVVNEKFGIMGVGSLTTNITIEQNSISDNGEFGIETLFVDNFNINKNVIENNLIAGIISENSNLNITGNSIRYSKEGILIHQSEGENIEIVDNDISKNVKGLLVNESSSMILSVRNNTFVENEYAGIYLENIYQDPSIVPDTEIKFSDNFIKGGKRYGLFINQSNDILIENGSFEDISQGYVSPQNIDKGIGILIQGSELVNITQGVFYNNSKGIVVENTLGVAIENSRFYEMNTAMIEVHGNNVGLSIFGNIVFNSYNGISYGEPEADNINLIIHSNQFINMYGTSIYLKKLTASSILFNEFLFGDEGIRLYSANATDVMNNYFYELQYYGVYLATSTREITIESNTFINNTLYGFDSYAYDSGQNNVFKQNYWSEWLTPDADGDGYVDEPYEIDGIANNADPLPLTTVTVTPRPLPPHFLSRPALKIRDGTMISGTYEISWNPAKDNIQGHPITYDLQFSSDNRTWNDIASGITDTSYEWNTLQVADGQYTIRNIANDQNGLSTVDFAVVVINNTATPPTTTSPPPQTSPTATTSETVTTSTEEPNSEQANGGFVTYPLMLIPISFLIFRRRRS